MQEGPSALHCPICMEIFQPPIVQCKSGHSVCKDCIETWMARKNTCPLDNGVIDSSRLVRNLSLEGVIAEIAPPTKARIKRVPIPPPAIAKRVPQRRAGRPLSPSLGLCAMICAVLVVVTAILFHISSPLPFTNTQTNAHSFTPTPQYYRHKSEHGWTGSSLSQQLSSTSILHVLGTCVEFVWSLFGWIFHKLTAAMYYLLLGLQWVESSVVRGCQYILKWNWGLFFRTIIYFIQVLVDCLWYIGITFFSVVKFILLATFFCCGVMLKGCVLMLHFGASVVLKVIEYVGL